MKKVRMKMKMSWVFEAEINVQTKTDSWSAGVDLPVEHEKLDMPLSILSIYGEKVVAQLCSGCEIFRSTVVRDVNGPIFHKETDDSTVLWKISRPVSKDVLVSSRKILLNGLLSNGTFSKTPRSEVPPGTRFFGSRFIIYMKLP